MNVSHDIVGGFNQPIMCGGEPRVMTRKNRGIADAPYYTIKIRVPKHGTLFFFAKNLIFLVSSLCYFCGVKDVHLGTSMHCLQIFQPVPQLIIS